MFVGEHKRRGEDGVSKRRGNLGNQKLGKGGRKSPRLEEVRLIKQHFLLKEKGGVDALLRGDAKGKIGCYGTGWGAKNSGQGISLDDKSVGRGKDT